MNAFRIPRRDALKAGLQELPDKLRKKDTSSYCSLYSVIALVMLKVVLAREYPQPQDDSGAVKAGAVAGAQPKPLSAGLFATAPFITE